MRFRTSLTQRERIVFSILFSLCGIMALLIYFFDMDYSLESKFFLIYRGHFQTRSSEEVPDLVCSYKSKMRA